MALGLGWFGMELVDRVSLTRAFMATDGSLCGKYQGTQLDGLSAGDTIRVEAV